MSARLLSRNPRTTSRASPGAAPVARLGFGVDPVVDLAQPEAGALYRECLPRLVVAETVLLDDRAASARPPPQGIAAVLDVTLLALVLDALARDEMARLGLAITPSLLSQDEPWCAVIRLLEARPMLASRLTVAVRENVLLANLAHAPVRLAALRRLGCRLAIDDIGSAAGSIGKDFAGFVWDQAIVDLARPAYHVREDGDCATLQALALRAASVAPLVSARGIESRSHLEAARAAGIRYGQGRLFEAMREESWTDFSRAEGTTLAAAMMAAGAVMRPAFETSRPPDEPPSGGRFYLMSGVDGLGGQARSLIHCAQGGGV